MQFRVNKPESTNLYCEVCPRDTRIFSPLKCLLSHLKSIAYSHCRTASSAHHNPGASNLSSSQTWHGIFVTRY